MNAVTHIDLERVRAETPGCKNVIHFNNAGAALMPKPVVEAVTRHLHLEMEMGGYEAARAAEEQIQHVYNAVASLIGAQPDEIALMQNATRAWQQVFYAIEFQAGDRILTSVSEYASNYIAFLQISHRTGAVIEVVPNDESGQLSIEALKNMLDARVKLIAITHIPTNGGLVNPAEAVGQLARKAGVLYLLDACQSAGQIPLDADAIGCDFLSATSRKYLRGPRGTGFLYVRRERIAQLEPPMLDLHAAEWVSQDQYEIRNDARRFETWETSYACNIGLAAAIDYATAIGMEPIWHRIQHLASLLRGHLQGIPGVMIQDLGVQQCGIISFSVAGSHPQAVCDWMRTAGINVNVSLPNSTLLDMQARHLDEGVIRASVHYYNTEAEIERFIDVLRGMKLRFNG